VAPFKVKNFSSPQEKTCLLLQMHLFNLPFLTRDYLNDCKLVLNSCCNVIIGLIDIAKNKRFLDTIMTCIRIQQAIYQGLTSNIPFITFDIWKKLDKRFIGLAGIIKRLHKQKEFQSELMGFLKTNVPEFD
jgi:hypothetical protein